MELVESKASFGGQQQVWSHRSEALGCEMRFAVYLPPQSRTGKCPVVYWLSGLTCTEQNFITKAGAQQYASELGLVIVAPDTSPRGAEVADDEGYDLGQGAGFYINSTQEPWAKHFQMASYLTQELPALIEAKFPVNERRSIFGHSMGGHGALVLSLRNPGMYRSVSAFAPIVAPTQVPWGKKAFLAYLGDDEQEWREWDTCHLLMKANNPLPMLVDQGEADGFLNDELKPELLKAVCEQQGHSLQLRIQEGYDHSYYFIASFMGDHLRHHAKALLE